MPKLQYTGLSHFRDISKKDFSDNDIEHDAVHVSRQDLTRADNPKRVPNAVEVSQEVADFLMEVEPKDWKLVKEDESFAEPDATVQVTETPVDEPVVTPDVAPAADGSEKPAPSARRR